MFYNTFYKVMKGLRIVRDFCLLVFFVFLDSNIIVTIIWTEFFFFLYFIPNMWLSLAYKK